MKAAKLIAALMPTLAVASNAAAQVSTTTVVNPVTTRTHTQIVFVTASAGPTVSTCLASFCGLNNGKSQMPQLIRRNVLTTYSLYQRVVYNQTYQLHYCNNHHRYDNVQGESKSETNSRSRYPTRYHCHH